MRSDAGRAASSASLRASLRGGAFGMSAFLGAARIVADRVPPGGDCAGSGPVPPLRRSCPVLGPPLPALARRLSPVTSLPLSQLLIHVATAVQAVRDGRSLNDALARCPAEARPGTQALAFEAMRKLGAAEVLRRRLVPKPPPPFVDALLLSVLALMWPGDRGDEDAGGELPGGGAHYAPHTLVNQAVDAAKQRARASASFVNAVLRRFLREQAAQVAAALADPLARHN